MVIAMVAMVGMPSGYKLVLSRAFGMYGIYYIGIDPVYHQTKFETYQMSC